LFFFCCIDQLFMQQRRSMPGQQVLTTGSTWRAEPTYVSAPALAEPMKVALPLPPGRFGAGGWCGGLVAPRRVQEEAPEAARPLPPGFTLPHAAQPSQPGRYPASPETRAGPGAAPQEEEELMRVPPGLAPPPGMPSHGSVLHASGSCRPCGFFWKAGGCQNGQECQHCHLCPEGKARQRKKQKQAWARSERSLEKEAPEPPMCRTPSTAASEDEGWLQAGSRSSSIGSLARYF